MSERSGRTERRVAKRDGARLPVEFHCGVLLGYGTMIDISLSGARIEEVDRRPPVGKKLKLLLRLSQSNGSLEVPAEVVRHTESGGFAVRFPDTNVQVLRILRSFLDLLAGLSEKQDR